MAEIFSNPDGSVVTREKAHAQDNPARALGIIGTVLSGLGILGLGIGSRGRNNWNNGNWNNGNYGGYYDKRRILWSWQNTSVSYGQSPNSLIFFLK